MSPLQIAHLQKTAPRSPSPAPPGAWPAKLQTTPDRDHVRNINCERSSQSQPPEPPAACSGLQHHALDQLSVCDTTTSTTGKDIVLNAPIPHLPHVETPPETAYMALSHSGSTDLTEQFGREKSTDVDIHALANLTHPQSTLDLELDLTSEFYKPEVPRATPSSISCGLLGVSLELPVQNLLSTEAPPPLIWPERPAPAIGLNTLETAIQLTPSIQMLAQRTQAFLLDFSGSQTFCEDSPIESQDNQHSSIDTSSFAAPHDGLLFEPSVASTDLDLFGFPNLLSSDIGAESTREFNRVLNPDLIPLLSQPDGDEAWTLLLGSASESLSFSSTPSPNSMSLSLSTASPLRPSEETERHAVFSSSLPFPSARGVEALCGSSDNGETEATQYAAALLETALAAVNSIAGPTSSSSEDDVPTVGVQILDSTGQQEVSGKNARSQSSHSKVVVRRVKKFSGKVKKFFSRNQAKRSDDRREGQRPGPPTADSLAFDQDEIVDMGGTPYEDQQTEGRFRPLTHPIGSAAIRSSVSSPIFPSALPPRNACATISEDPDILSPPSVHHSAAAYQTILRASQSSPLDGIVEPTNQHSLHSYGIISRPKTLAEIKSKRRLSLPAFSSSFPSSASSLLGTSVVAASAPLPRPRSTMICIQNENASGGSYAGVFSPTREADQRARSVIEADIPVSSLPNFQLPKPMKKKIWQSLPRISTLRKS